jgi:hypothetical protein
MGEFSTQEAAQEVNDLLQQEGFSSSQSSTQVLEAASDSSVSQIKTQRNAGRGAITGGIFGALIGLTACIVQVLVSGSPFLPGDSALSILAVSAAAGLIGVISFSLIGVISTSKVPTKPIPNSPVVPSPQYSVTVSGSETDIIKATEIIQTNGGKV